MGEGGWGGGGVKGSVKGGCWRSWWGNKGQCETEKKCGCWRSWWGRGGGGGVRGSVKGGGGKVDGQVGRRGGCWMSC